MPSSALSPGTTGFQSQQCMEWISLSAPAHGKYVKDYIRLRGPAVTCECMWMYVKDCICMTHGNKLACTHKCLHPS
eukprot:1138891-Pelagomonas_calceolata.AAC.5